MAKHIHLIGICGSAMASLAGMLQTKGYNITGSDAAAYPPMSDLLKALGIPIMEPYAETNLSPRPDLVIVGNAISRGNVELEAVLDQRIPFRSLAETIHHDSSLAKTRWWLPGPTEKPPPPACWPGSMKSLRSVGPRLRHPS